jgi:hypothetical protein
VSNMDGAKTLSHIHLSRGGCVLGQPCQKRRGVVAKVCQIP